VSILSIKACALSKLLIFAAFLDYDGNTVFGTPWEMLFQNSYLTHSKIGLMAGYCGLLTFLPELQLSTLVTAIEFCSVHSSFWFILLLTEHSHAQCMHV